MTPNQLHSSDRFAAELLQSRQLGRKFANALAQPMAFKSRPLHRFEAGFSLFKAGDRVTQLPYVMSGRLDAVVHRADGLHRCEEVLVLHGVLLFLSDAQDQIGRFSHQPHHSGHPRLQNGPLMTMHRALNSTAASARNRPSRWMPRVPTE